MGTQTSPIKTTREDRVVIIPEARPRRRWVPLVVAVVAVLALVLGAAGGYLFQRGALRDRDSRIAAAQDAARQAALDADLAVARAANAALLVGGLRTQLDLARRESALALAGKTELASLVAETRLKLAATRGRILDIRRHARQLTGAPLQDGRHLGRLLAVGARQSPPRVVFDPGRWLTGEAARQAAIADGVIGPNDRLPHARYFRNRVVAWRIVRLAPDARVSLRSRRGEPVWVRDIVRLHDVFIRDTNRAIGLRHDPYWIVVEAGKIVSIRRQTYP